MKYVPFAIYAVCIALGFLARRRLGMSAVAATRLSWWTGWVIYPAMAFSSVTSYFTKEALLYHWHLPLLEFLIMAFGAAVAFVAVRKVSFPSPSYEATFGFNLTIGNYVFLPLPLAIFLWGPEAAPNIIVASLGAEVAFWTIGVGFLRGGGLHVGDFFTPAVLALALGFVEILLDHPGLHSATVVANVVLSKIGALTIPLAMFLLGFHLAAAVKVRLWDRYVTSVTLFRAIVVPAAFLVFLRFVPLSPDVGKALFLVATMPVAVASVYMSDLFGGSPELAVKCVVAGHLFSLVSVPLWLWAVG